MIKELFSFKGHYSGLRTFVTAIVVTVTSLIATLALLAPGAVIGNDAAFALGITLIVPVAVANAWIGLAMVTKRFRDVAPGNVTMMWVLYVVSSIVSGFVPVFGALITITWMVIIYIVPGQVAKSGGNLMEVKP